MRPVSVFANGPGSEIERLEADLRGRWREAARAVMVLLSAHGLPPAMIAELLDCHPATVRRPAAKTSAKVWAEDPATGRRRDLTVEDDRAFWTWAAVAVLRLTGIFSAGHPLRRKLISAFAQLRG